MISRDHKGETFSWQRTNNQRGSNNKQSLATTRPPAIRPELGPTGAGDDPPHTGDEVHQKIFEEIDQTSTLTGMFKPISFQELGTDSSSFALSLGTQEFSPEELSVKQMGRKLRVSGKTEKKKEDEKGSYSYKCQEFRQVFDLPSDVDPETVTCSLVGGKLQIQAPPDKVVTDRKERVVLITLTSAPAITSSSGGTEGNSTSSSSESCPAEKN
ncbi:heat shock protein beta-11-like [Acanthopagrus schlegelii]